MKPGKILIVDDFNTNIRYLTRLLKDEGYEVWSENNADAGLRMISSAEFDLILLDVVMPGTDGFTLCELVRKSKFNATTPIIFITSKKDEISILKGFELGGQDYVIRPFNNSELLARVNTHIELKRNRAELKSLNEKLERTVARRTHELKTALDKLKLSYNKLNTAQNELLRLDRVKENFLKIINHELRTPLNGIIGFHELIKESYRDEKLINYLEMMRISVSRLEKFSMNALFITQLKAGMYKLDIEYINVRSIIDYVMKQYIAKLEAENIRIRMEVKDSLICTDENLFQYTFRNLLENAIYHTPRNRSITIRGEKVKGNYYQLQVLDSGKGFPPEIINSKYRLFINENFIDSRPGLSLFTISLIMRYLKGKMQLANSVEGGASVLVKIKSLPA
jgi:two-component system, sensor histidine kinase and response regulator